LEVLLNETIAHDASFTQFVEPCRKITQFYLEDRYPYVVASELTRAEIVEALVVAEQVIARIGSA
jgi:hypothetical protein